MRLLSDLPPELLNLVTGFAFDATPDETLASLDLILDMKRHDIHPFMLTTMVGDYSLCKNHWHYDRATHRASIMGPYCPLRKVTPNPFVEFHSVWFSFADLFNYFSIQQILFDIDWRCVKHICKQIGYRNREAFSDWVCNSSDGIVFCSTFFKAINLPWLKKYPSELSRFIAVQNAMLYP